MNVFSENVFSEAELAYAAKENHLKRISLSQRRRILHAYMDVYELLRHWYEQEEGYAWGSFAVHVFGYLWNTNDVIVATSNSLQEARSFRGLHLPIDRFPELYAAIVAVNDTAESWCGAILLPPFFTAHERAQLEAERYVNRE